MDKWFSFRNWTRRQKVENGPVKKGRSAKLRCPLCRIRRTMGLKAPGAALGARNLSQHSSLSSPLPTGAAESHLIIGFVENRTPRRIRSSFFFLSPSSYFSSSSRQLPLMHHRPVKVWHAVQELYRFPRFFFRSAKSPWGLWAYFPYSWTSIASGQARASPFHSLLHVGTRGYFYVSPFMWQGGYYPPPLKSPHPLQLLCNRLFLGNDFLNTLEGGRGR